MRTAIDDRTLATVGSVEYVGVIHVDESPSNPMTDWDMAGSYTLFGDEASRQDFLFGRTDLPTRYDMADKLSQRLFDQFDEAYDDMRYSDDVTPIVATYLEALKRYDPSGVYLPMKYDNDRHAGDAAYIVDDIEEANGIAWTSSQTIRREQNYKRISAANRQRAIDCMKSELKTFNAWANGDVYGWEVIRQTLDEHGEVIESESLDSVWGYYGTDEWEYMYSEALAAAQSDIAKRADNESTAFKAMDEFAAVA